MLIKALSQDKSRTKENYDKMCFNYELDILSIEVRYRTQLLEVAPVTYLISVRSECAATLSIARRCQQWWLISDQATRAPRSLPQHVSQSMRERR
jgi:hypothetical protein